MAFLQNVFPVGRRSAALYRSVSTVPGAVRSMCPASRSGLHRARQLGTRMSQTPPPSREEEDSPPRGPSTEDMLLQDLQSFKRKREGDAQGDGGKVGGSSGEGGRSLKAALDAVLIANFFMVVGLLVWLVVALVPHFAAKDDSLLDPWLALWQPFIQPVLGVLMLGTIAQGSISFFSK